MGIDETPKLPVCDIYAQEKGISHEHKYASDNMLQDHNNKRDIGIITV